MIICNGKSMAAVHEARQSHQEIYRHGTESDADVSLIVLEYQPLLLRCLDCTRNKASNPLERFSTREPQAPFCQVGSQQPCTLISALRQALSRRDVVSCVISWKKQRLLFSWRPISACL